MAISSHQLSVVIQGPLHNPEVGAAERAVRSVRKYFPHAQIILSTTDVDSSISFEKVQLVNSNNVDHFNDINGGINNVNKLIITTRNGLAIAKRKYCLKMRTDHIVLSNNLLALLGDDQSSKFFSARIGISNLFLRNPIKIPYLFHLSDTIQFGRTEDLRHLWNIDPLPADFVYLKDGPRFNPFGIFHGYTSFRLLPEQAIFLCFARKNGVNIDLPHISYTTFQLFNKWECILLENFEVYNWDQIGIEPPSRFLTHPYMPSSIFNQDDIYLLRSHSSIFRKYIRYLRLIINKYIFCFFNIRWVFSTFAILLFYFSPKLAIKIRHFYLSLVKAHRL